MAWSARGMRLVVGLGCVLAWGPAAPEAHAAPSAAKRVGVAQPLYHKNRSFRVPFEVDEADRNRIKEVQLYYSTDQGQTWHAANRTTPDQTSFPTFRAPRDAEYWFAVRTLDVKGRLYPPDDAPIETNLKVVVDTTPPVLELAPMGRRGDRAKVRWEISDENLVPKSLVIQYKAEGARDWRQVPIRDYALSGSEEWSAGTAASLMVRAWVDDRAGNRTQTEILLPDGIAAQPGSNEPDDVGFEPPPSIAPISSPEARDGGPSGRMGGVDADPFARSNRRSRNQSATDDLDDGFDPPVVNSRNGDDGFDPLPRSRGTAARTPPPDADVRSLLVPSPRFALQYDVEDAGPDGPALVELWVTRDDGQTWRRQPPDEDRTSPYDVNLGGEGTFGLRLVVQSAANLGDRPPSPGDRPQLIVEVDSSAPFVRLDPPRVGNGPALGKVLITWRATDPHLASKPVLISYRADRADAPWIPIERVDNTGRYIWTVPTNVPSRVHLRVDVLDSLGNRSHAETSQDGPILVDRSRPKGKILGLDPRTAPGMGERTRQ